MTILILYFWSNPFIIDDLSRLKHDRLQSFINLVICVQLFLFPHFFEAKMLVHTAHRQLLKLMSLST